MAKTNWNNNNFSKNATPAAIAGGITLVLIVFALLTGLRSVEVGHIGIVTSFGKIVGETLDPGLHFVYPWRKVVSLDCRTQKTSENTDCYSLDLQLIQADITILTVLTKEKAVSVYSTIGVNYIDQVRPQVFEVLKQTIAKYDAEKIIESRGQIREEVIKASKERLEYILDVQDVVISNFDFSDEYERAIEQKQVALQDSLRAKHELDKAKVEAEKEIEIAKGEAEAIKVRGEAMQANPGVAQLEAIKKWDGKSPQTVVLQGKDATDVPVIFPIK